MAKATVAQAKRYAQALGYKTASGGGIYHGKTRLANGWKDFIDKYSPAILSWLSKLSREPKFTRARISRMEESE